MIIRPANMNTITAGSSSGSENAEKLLADLPTNQVFVKNELGKLVGIGIRQLADGTVLAPNNFGVESGSVNFGDLITLSEAAGYLGIWNHLNDKHYQVVDYWVPRDRPSSDPYFFKLTEGEYRFDANSSEDTVITSNPLTFTYITQFNARTNSIIFTASKAMKNVRLKISVGDIAIKYLPTKADYLNGSNGYDFSKGENIVDFLDSPIPLSKGVTLTYEIVADNISLLGSKDKMPKISAYLQRGEYVNLASEQSLAPVAYSGSFKDLSDKPAGSTSQVNSDWNASEGVAEILNKPEIFSGSWKDLKDKPELFDGDYNALSNRPDLFSGDYDDLSNRPLLFSGEYIDLKGAPSISEVAETGSYNDLTDKPELFDGDYNSLTNLPEIPDAQVQADWDQTDTDSADYIKNKPTIPTVKYPVRSVNAKTGAVVLTNTDVGAAAAEHTHDMSDISGLSEALADKVGSTDEIPYSRITGTPILAQVATSGDYSDLKNKPVIPTVSYPVSSVNGKTGAITLTNTDVGAAALSHTHTLKDVTGLQTALDGKISTGAQIPYNTLTGIPSFAVVATTGSYSDLLNKPTLFSGSYNDLTNKPALFSGSYADLTNKPVLFDGTWASLTGKPSFATVATSGSYADLADKPTIPSAQVNSDWNATSGLAQILNKPTIPTTTSQLTNNSGYLTSAPVSSVNSKTGAVVLTATDVGAAPTAQGTKYYRAAGTQVTGVKVKYYSVVSDSNGTWTLSLGTDFTELLDVQATAMATSSAVGGVRQATVNTFTATDKTLTGAVFTNSVIVTILLGGTNSLTMASGATVRVRVEGVGT